ncbi:MAG: ATP-binding protein [Desulfobulbaceae bacterium]|nr:ATP-binding protein [Desulfobulbaceae bacterium]
MDWESAFFAQYQDACVGRLLRGVIHNLNGVNQAFSLQATLFHTMFLQAEKILLDAESLCPRTDCSLLSLRELFRKRVVMVNQMEEKVETSQRIVSRVLPLSQLYELEEGRAVSLATIVEMELEILAADSFFKHRVTKSVLLSDDLPLFTKRFLELHTICFVLLDNAAKAMRDLVSPALSLTARHTDDFLVIEVRDSGHGVSQEHASQIFEPFFSTREGALGVGLFLAKKTVTDMGGTLLYSSVPGDTCFTVTLPLSSVL